MDLCLYRFLNTAKTVHVGSVARVSGQHAACDAVNANVVVVVVLIMPMDMLRDNNATTNDRINVLLNYQEMIAEFRPMSLRII